MKKKSKKSKKKNPSKRNIKKRKIVKIKNKIQRNFKKKKKKKKKNINSKKNLFHQSSKKNNKVLLKIINLQDKFKPNIKIKFNPFVSLDKFLLKFFQNISDTIGEYKSLKIEQKRILKIKEMERIENEKKREVGTN